MLMYGDFLLCGRLLFFLLCGEVVAKSACQRLWQQFIEPIERPGFVGEYAGGWLGDSSRRISRPYSTSRLIGWQTGYSHPVSGETKVLEEEESREDRDEGELERDARGDAGPRRQNAHARREPFRAGGREPELQGSLQHIE